MSVKIIENSSGTIRPSEGYGPILRPTARETYSLRQQIFELVRASGRIARAKIARTLNISPGSVTALTAELISDGFLREVEEISREISRGRPPVALELVPDALYVIGVKLSDEVHTATLTVLIKKVCESAKLPQKSISAIGVGISGIVNYTTGVVSWSPLLEDLDTPLGNIFSTHFETPVCIDNDANVLTLAELWFGAGRALSNFAVITIEHGVGMGFVSDNRLFRGAHSMGLELGHSKVHLDGALCRCGQRGCLEAYLADYALAREASTALITPPTKRQNLNDYLKDLYEMAKLGDQASLKIFKRAGRYLAVAISNVIHLFDPKLIILSGKPMQYEFLYDEEMQTEMRSLALYKSRYDTQIEIQSWGSMVWARGATALALTELTKTVVVEGH